MEITEIIEPRKPVPTFFIWRKDERIIDRLFQLLVHYELVEDNPAKFKLLFSNSLDKVGWIARKFNSVQVAHLFYELVDRGFICKSQKRDVSRIITARIAAERPIKNLSKNYSQFRRLGKIQSDDISTVDKILTSLEEYSRQIYNRIPTESQ